MIVGGKGSIYLSRQSIHHLWQSGTSTVLLIKLILRYVHCCQLLIFVQCACVFCALNKKDMSEITENVKNACYSATSLPTYHFHVNKTYLICIAWYIVYLLRGSKTLSFACCLKPVLTDQTMDHKNKR